MIDVVSEQRCVVVVADAFQKQFKSGAGSTHLVDFANHILLVPQVC